jgi:putative redox protein
MDLKITFPGGLQVDADYGPLHITTNQDGSAPPPFALFLASIGTCAGFYVLSFCRQRGIATDGLAIRQEMEVDPSNNLIKKIAIKIQLPEEFPDKYKEAVIRAADHCTVKKHLAAPPAFEITAS